MMGGGGGGVKHLAARISVKAYSTCVHLLQYLLRAGRGGDLACNKKLLFGKVVFIRDLVHPSLFQSSLPPTFHASFIQSFFHSSLPQTNQFGQRWFTLFYRCLLYVCLVGVHRAEKALPEAPKFRPSLDQTLLPSSNPCNHSFILPSFHSSALHF